MAIFVDHLFCTTPFTNSKTPSTFRNTLASHMMSDLPGAEGTNELIGFAIKLGLQKRWIQYPGTHKEHFDLTESKHKLAISKGAILCPVEVLIEIEKEKIKQIRSLRGIK